MATNQEPGSQLLVRIKSLWPCFASIPALLYYNVAVVSCFQILLMTLVSTMSCSRKGFTGRRKHSVLTFSYFQSVDFFVKVKSNLSGEDCTDHNKEDTEDTVHEA